MSYRTGPKIVTDGLVLCLDAADRNSYPGSGSTWYDLSGNGINGSLINGTSFVDVNKGVLNFDNTNDYVSLGTPSQINQVQVPLSFCLWAKADSFSSYDVLWAADKSTSGVGLYSMLRIDGGGYPRYFTSTSGGSYQYKQFTTQLSVNTWYFYAITVSGTLSSPYLRIYINDTVQGFSLSSLSTTPMADVDFRIGGNQRTTTEYWDGYIANVLWYNRDLSIDEMRQNFEATKGRFGL
jgi:hypothetical protein